MPNLKGKRVIVTGASKGLGLVAAKALAEQGARLALVARTTDKLESLRQSLPNPQWHAVVEADLTAVATLESRVTQCLERLDGVDAVLHCAGGGLGLKDPLLTYPDFMKLLALNLASAMEINRVLAPVMKKQGSGNLVHVGSIASYEGVGSVGYNTAKAGLSAYVRSLGRELAEFGIIATGILPGGFHAPENAMDRLAKNNPQAYRDFVEQRLPRKRMGDAKELVPFLLLLCSEEASMMAGCLIPIDAAEGRAYSI